MRILFVYVCLTVFIQSAFSQGTDCPNATTDVSYAWVMPASPDVEDSVTIFINLKTDPECEKLMDVTDEEVFLWTWSPDEPVIGNGTWGNSNPDMKMKKVDEGLYSFTMIPTEFYDVSPDDFYNKGICLLAKLKDGGSGGDCSVDGGEFKTSDAHINIPIPEGTARKVYSFPDVYDRDSVAIRLDDAFTLIYDNNLEDPDEKPELIDVEEMWVYFRVVGSDGRSYKKTSLSQVGNDPDLKMTNEGDGIFTFSFFPEELMEGVLPDGITPEKLRFQLITWPLCGSECAVEGDFYFTLKCVID